MPIVFSCSECDHTIKAPDEVAGRKVKCPKCKAVLTVPAAVTAKPSAAPPAARQENVTEEPPRRMGPPPRGEGRRPSRDPDEDDDDRPRRRPRDEDDEPADDEEDEAPKAKKRRDDDEEEEEEDRPRKKKKKKKESGSTQMTMILIGVGALVVIGGVFLVYFVWLHSRTGEKSPAPAGDKIGTKEDPKADRGGGPPVGGGPLPRDRNLELDMKIIGLGYHNYFDATRKGPSRAEDLQPFIADSPTAFEALRSGRVIFIYNVRLLEMTDGTSNTVLAYERDAPTRGGLVLFGDASVQVLSAAEFATKPQARPKK